MTRPNRISNALANVTFTDLSTVDRDVLVRQYVSQALEPGQTFTGAQALKLQCRISETLDANELFFACGVRIIASDGTTVRKTVLAVTRDNVESTISLQNRQFTATSAATNYTTQAGDRIVIELGAGGDPTGSKHHDFTLRLGDSSGTDLSEDDTSTTDNNPWIEFADTLAFVYAATAAPTVSNATCSGSATYGSGTFTGTAAVTATNATCAGTATFVKPVYAGTAAVSASNATCAGSATFEEVSTSHPVGRLTQFHYGLSGIRYGDLSKAPDIPGPHNVTQITQNRYGLSGRRYSNFLRPPQDFQATAAVTVSNATCAGAATFVKPVYTGAAAVTVSGATCSAAATFAPGTKTASASVSATNATCAGTATYSSGVNTASAAVSSTQATCAGLATFTRPVYTGTAAVSATKATCHGDAIFSLVAGVYIASANVTVTNATCAGQVTGGKSWPAVASFLRRGPGSARFVRSGPGNASFQRSGPGNASFTSKTSHN